MACRKSLLSIIRDITYEKFHRNNSELLLEQDVKGAIPFNITAQKAFNRVCANMVEAPVSRGQCNIALHALFHCNRVLEAICGFTSSC